MRIIIINIRDVYQLRVINVSDSARSTQSNRTQPGSSLRRLNSTELFAGLARVVIEHEGSAYVLQITRQGKLILTK